MEALTLEQYSEIVNFVQKWHYFAVYLSDEQVKERNKQYPNMGKWRDYGMNIKYIDSIYDSRDAKIWSITFRGMGHKYNFTSNHFNGTNPMPKEWRWKTLHAMIMAFLKGEMTDKQTSKFIIKER